MSEYKTRCSTKAKRAALAKEIEALAAECGATVKRGEFEHPKEVKLTISYGDYRVSVGFDGSYNCGAFLGHWHMAHTSKLAIYPRNFSSVIGGSMNTIHWGKATTCEDTFEGLTRSLRAGLECLRDWDVDAA